MKILQSTASHPEPDGMVDIALRPTGRNAELDRRSRPLTTVLTVAAAIAAVIAPASIPSSPALGQEAEHVNVDAESPSRSADNLVLTEYGLDTASIDAAADLDLLWRVVREVVLPGRVSEKTQHRILRRVWLVDPVIANGSFYHSDSH